MRLKAPRNEAALTALGVAQFKSIAIAHEVDADNNIVAYLVPDNLDLTDYDKAVAELTAPSVPSAISRRQFAQVLAGTGAITQDEALSFIRTGTLPKALQDAVDGLSDADQKFAAEMLLSGAATFERDHPMVAVLGKALKKSDADLDALWVAAAGL